MYSEECFMSRPFIAIMHWLPDAELARWRSEFSGCDFIEAREPALQAEHLPRATVAYGIPDLKLLPQATALKWIQLASAGVPGAFCPVAKQQQIRVTNLAGLYGPT